MEMVTLVQPVNYELDYTAQQTFTGNQDQVLRQQGIIPLAIDST